MGRLLQIFELRVLWPVLLLLAAFVIFFECIADVGVDERLESPTILPVPAATSSPGQPAPP